MISHSYLVETEKENLSHHVPTTLNPPSTHLSRTNSPLQTQDLNLTFLTWTSDLKPTSPPQATPPGQPSLPLNPPGSHNPLLCLFLTQLSCWCPRLIFRGFLVLKSLRKATRVPLPQNACCLKKETKTVGFLGYHFENYDSFWWHRLSA